MSKDRFRVFLKCATCGAEGIADCTQEDGWAYAKGARETTVDYLPDGFKVVEVRSDFGEISFFCSKDNISAFNGYAGRGTACNVA